MQDKAKDSSHKQEREDGGVKAGIVFLKRREVILSSSDRVGFLDVASEACQESNVKNPTYGF